MIDVGGSRFRSRIAIVLIAAVLVLATFGLILELGAGSPDCGVGDADTPVEIVTLAATNTHGVDTATLESRTAYEFVVRGTYTFNELGELADGASLSVNDLRIAALATGDHVYCLRLFGAGAPVALRIRDSYHGDNGGARWSHAGDRADPDG